MQESTSKEKILKSIRAALVEPMAAPGMDEEYENQIYTPKDRSFLEATFAESFAAINGQFIYCQDQKELVANIQDLAQELDLKHIYCFEPQLQEIFNAERLAYSHDDSQYLNCEAAITGCEYLVARLGSVMVSSKQGWARKGFIYPPVHLVVADSSQMVYDLSDAFRALKSKYQQDIPSLVTLVSGPSRTADIEKTLVLGAHGPKKIFVFLLDK